MEAYRNQLRGRIGWLAAGILLVALLMLVSSDVIDVGLPADGVGDYVHGMQAGLCAALLVLLVLQTARYQRVQHSPKLLERMYLQETDERNRFIRDKIGGIGYNAAILFFSIATVTAALFNETVFFTLLASVAIMVFIRAGLKLFYRARI